MERTANSCACWLRERSCLRRVILPPCFLTTLGNTHVHAMSRCFVVVPRFQHVYATVSDSAIPLLVLVEGFSSSSFTFWYTPEKSNKVKYLSRYFESKFPSTQFGFVELPSMNNPAAQVLAIREHLSILNREDPSPSAVFVSAGTSTMALSMWFHARSNSWISLRKGLELTIWNPTEGTQRTSICVDGTTLTLQQILYSRGWIYNGKSLQNEGGIIGQDITVTYDAEQGVLSFLKNIKSSKSRVGERAVSFMSALLDEFGLNGATYEIRGPLSNRALNLMNPAIAHTEREGEEE
jgi:hypothetical protein